MKKIVLISRILTGIVFATSGFVKAVDPLGSAYKFNDYFSAFGTEWANNLSFFLSISLSFLEFIVGYNLIFGINIKKSSWGALLFMIVFTPLTFILFLSEKFNWGINVTDCGCFGDFIKFTNLETFIKNLFISILVLVVFFNRNKISNNYKLLKSTLFVIGSFSIFYIQYYSYNHLPIIDFRPYKIGTYIPDGIKIPLDAPKDIYISNYTIKNGKTNETKTINSDEYLADSTYWHSNSEWTFVSADDPILIKKGYEAPIHDFNFNNKFGVDITDQILDTNNSCLLWISYNFEKTNLDAQKNFYQTFKTLNDKDIKIWGATSSSLENIESFNKEYNLNYEFLNADETMLKTVIRSNPGLVLISKGKILNKWHYNDLPSIEEIISTLKK